MIFQYFAARLDPGEGPVAERFRRAISDQFARAAAGLPMQ
jgi:hypothetical protein